MNYDDQRSKNFQPSALTADLAFVVQLQRTAGQAAFQGRVEHVVSGECKRFTSKEDLCGAIDTIMTQLQQS